MNDALLIFAGLVAHAWITRVQGPPARVNAVAWFCAVLLTVIAIGLVVMGLVRR